MRHPFPIAETPVAVHLRLLRERREVAILATIPKVLHLYPGILRACERYAFMVAANVSNRRLRRVIYPWQRRPVDPAKHPKARVKRGRLRNPTALR